MANAGTLSRRLDATGEVARSLLRARRFDEIALALQRQGWLDVYGEARGQETGQIGVALELEPEDMIFPSYRQPGVALHRGVPPADLLRYYAGAKFLGWDWRKHHFAAYSIPVGSQLAHAVGYAWAHRLRSEPRAVVTFFGDGAASQGEVHEAMNYAGVFRAPVVFVCENNGWAISLPTSRQTAAESIASRAAGYGFEGRRVAGDDLDAVREATRWAVGRARAGEGPALIEIVCYRLGAHTTSDDPRRYRAADEWDEWNRRDPVTGFIEAKVEAGALSRDVVDELRKEIDAEFDAVVEAWVSEREALR